MKIKIDTKQIMEISGTDKKCLKNDLLDIEDWIIKAIEGKINKCKKRLIREWQQKLMVDSSVKTIPANEEDFIKLITSHPDYKNRVEREAEDKEKEN